MKIKKKTYIWIGIIILALFISIKIVYASSGSSGIFGGKITDTKATEIKKAEDNGYTCTVSGTSITINPIVGPKTYIIPSSITSRTGTTPSSRQWIIGKYSGKTTITCIKQEGETTSTKEVRLNKITLFGTSR